MDSLATISCLDGYDVRACPDAYMLAEHAHASVSPIVQALIYTRRFVPTYYAVLAAIVLAFAILRAFSRRYDSSKHGMGHANPTTSSSSSTLVGSPSPSPKVVDYTELSSLLGHDQKAWRWTYVWDRVRCYIRYALISQPRPIPAMTTDKNRLPPNGTSLMIIFLLGINIFYLFNRNPLSVDRVQAFADRAGLLFAANLPVLYVLAAKSQKPFKNVGWSLQDLTGWSYEGLNIFHRRLGEWMVALAVIHSAGMFVLWYTKFMPTGFSLAHFLSLKIVILGYCALASFLLLYVCSTGYARRRSYELFLVSHIFFQLAALLLLFFHHHNARPYVGAALAVWALDRIVSRSMKKEQYVATLQVAEDGETVLLFCDIPLNPSKIAGSLSGQGWAAGQHCFVTVSGISSKHFYQAHPFTIASPAPSRGDGTWPLQLIMRAQDGFTRDLLEYAKFHQHTMVTLEGPYGSTEALDAIHASDRTCLIAGGSGISVTWPLSWHMANKDGHIAMVSRRTVYENGRKMKPQVRLLRRSQHAQQDSIHFWVRQSPTNDSWLTMFPRHKAQMSHDLDSESQTVTDLLDKAYDTKHGRPDLGTELREWVTSDGAVGGKERSICVVVSGPEALTRDIRNCAASLARQGYRIRVVVEKFSW